MKNIVQKYGSLFGVAGMVIALDQWTKYLVRTHLALSETWLPPALTWLSPWARFVHWYNTGSAFGLFQNRGPLFAALAVFVAAMIIYYYPQIEPSDWALRLALGLQMGGALGNMIDRMIIGHVVDFISVGTFPVFNIADSALTVGVGFLLLGWYIQERRLRAQDAAASADREMVSDE